MMETNPETNCGQWKPEWWRVPNAVTVLVLCLSRGGSRGHMLPLTKVGDKTCPPQLFLGDLEKAEILFWKPKIITKSRGKKVFSNTKMTFFYLLVRFESSPNSPPFHGACLPHFHVPSESLQPTFQSTATPLWIIITSIQTCIQNAATYTYFQFYSCVIHNPPFFLTTVKYV